MNNQERAELIFQQHMRDHSCWVNRSLIAAQLDEACMDAMDQIHKIDAEVRDRQIVIMRKQGYAEGFRAAKEKAKGIAEGQGGIWRDVGKVIAQRIGNLQP